MLIIARILWFVNSAISVSIAVVIALMIVRLIADAMDLNPFAWSSRTIRRLTDGLVIPVRGGLRGFGVDPKFAPLVVILIAIVLGYFVIRLFATVANMVLGIIESAQRGAFIWVLGFILLGLISIYMLLVIIRVIFSWGMLSYSNRIMRFLIDVTEPLLGPLRRTIPLLGQFDISPIVALLLLWLLQAAVGGTLLSGAPIPSF
ncbi:MAG TPA: YggT family protein [Pyrinomonadaceae bacterium]|jgi:YggT family protein|nr:YggT family protein [Pyrinomonadaceae bacterium]